MLNLGLVSYLFLALILIELTTVMLNKDVIPPFMEEVYNTTEAMWLLWLAIVVAAPIFEEVFFRGFLLSGLNKSFLGPHVCRYHDISILGRDSSSI